MLKRKASEDSIDDETRKHHRMVLVPKPIPKSSIYSPSASNYQDIRDKLGLEKEEFLLIAKSIREVALKMLRISDPQSTQNKRNWAAFKAEVCKKHPVFVQFEDEWPLMAYIRRWSFWRSRAASKFKEELVGSVFDPCSEENLDTDGQQPNEICDIAGSSTEQSLQMSLPSQTPGSVSGSTRLSSNIGVLATSHALGTDQIFIPRPTNEDELRNIAKTTLEHLREAMKFETRPFASLKSVLQCLALKYLDMDSPLSQQTRERWDAYKAEASRLEPLLSSQYEGAWPLSVYTDRYLERRIMKRKQRNTNEYMPSLGVTDMEEVKYSPDALTATPSVQNRTSSRGIRGVQSYASIPPPNLPTVSSFTSSPAVFEVPSTQLSSLPPTFRPAIGNSLDREKFSSPTMPSTSNAHRTSPTTCSQVRATAESASFHVRQFLSSLFPLPLDSDAIIQQFVEVGVFDEKTLNAFKNCTLAQVERLTAAIALTPLERLSLQHYFESAHREPIIAL